MLSVSSMNQEELRVVGDTNITLEGEFHVDLYTLPENLIKMLWDFTTEKVQISAAA